LDHGKSFAVIKEAIMAGYDSVHFDGSNLSWEENVEMTRQIVRWAKRYDVFVEGELGYLRGSSSVHEIVKIQKDDLTEPKQAAEFVEATGVDSLAIAIGNIHGVTSKKTKNPALFLDRLAEIDKKIGQDAFLVLHGGSGTPEKDIEEAVKKGIAKVNVNTELRVAYTKNLKRSLEENPRQTTPYKIMPPAVDAVQKVVEKKIKLFGSSKRC
jgi:tagatose 1,6-diphosphate aldolase GatY/KbaY